MRKEHGSCHRAAFAAGDEMRKKPPKRWRSRAPGRDHSRRTCASGDGCAQTRARRCSKRSIRLLVKFGSGGNVKWVVARRTAFACEGADRHAREPGDESRGRQARGELKLPRFGGRIARRIRGALPHVGEGRYARQRLSESGEEADARERHLAYFVRLTEEAAPRIFRRRARQALDRSIGRGAR